MKKTLLSLSILFALILNTYSASSSFDFETGDLSGWEKASTGGTAEITTEDKHGGTYAIKLTSPETGNPWSLQFSKTISVVAGNKYKFTFWAKAVGGDGVIRISTAAGQLVSDEGEDRQYLPDRQITSDWAQYTYEVVYGGDLVAVGSSLQVNFDMGSVINKTYYLDDIVIEDLTDPNGQPQPTTNSFDFETGTLDGWNKQNEGAGIAITQEDKHGGSYAVKLTASSTSSDPWDVQLQTPVMTVVAGHKYKISFWAKAVGGNGVIRISTGANQLESESGEGRQYLTDQNITADWTQFTYETVYGSGLVAVGTTLQLSFDMGTIADKVYYLDDVVVEDLTGGSTPGEGSFDFETGNLNEWNKQNEGAGIAITQEDKHGGSYAVKLTASSTSSDPWDLQLQSPVINVVQGGIYKISFWAKAVGGNGVIRISTGANQLVSESGEDRQYLSDQNITADWAQYTYETVYGSGLKAVGTTLQLSFDMGTVANKVYYIDDVVVEAVGTSGLINTGYEKNTLYLNDNVLYTTTESDIQVYDIKGTLRVSAQGVSSLDISTLTSGVYIVKTQQDGKSYVNKIVK